MAGATLDCSLNRNLHFLFGKWLWRLPETVRAALDCWANEKGAGGGRG